LLPLLLALSLLLRGHAQARERGQKALRPFVPDAAAIAGDAREGPAVFRHGGKKKGKKADDARQSQRQGFCLLPLATDSALVAFLLIAPSTVATAVGACSCGRQQQRWVEQLAALKTRGCTKTRWLFAAVLFGVRCSLGSRARLSCLAVHRQC
jgi:hypothetical protein